MNVGQWLDPQYGLTEETSPDGKVFEWPTYVCGHCGDTVALNPMRQRPRSKCYRCGSLICEERPICTTECLPHHSLFLDGFPGPLGKRAIAVMDGARTTDEVDRRVLGAA